MSDGTVMLTMFHGDAMLCRVSRADFLRYYPALPPDELALVEALQPGESATLGLPAYSKPVVVRRESSPEQQRARLERLAVKAVAHGYQTSWLGLPPRVSALCVDVHHTLPLHGAAWLLYHPDGGCSANYAGPARHLAEMAERLLLAQAQVSESEP